MWVHVVRRFSASVTRTGTGWSPRESSSDTPWRVSSSEAFSNWRPLLGLFTRVCIFVCSYHKTLSYRDYHSRSNLQSITAPNSVAASRLRLSGPNCSELIRPHRALPGQMSTLNNIRFIVYVFTYSEGRGLIVIQNSDSAVISTHSNVPRQQVINAFWTLESVSASWILVLGIGDWGLGLDHSLVLTYFPSVDRSRHVSRPFFVTSTFLISSPVTVSQNPSLNAIWCNLCCNVSPLIRSHLLSAVSSRACTLLGCSLPPRIPEYLHIIVKLSSKSGRLLDPKLEATV